ncbi:hypothetical protein HY967_00560 [Candidatus Jorgensenbacteria bacterium]|nr:hypothetical protein [Candidatus Jorgensenbacteria bacterium]
MRFLLRILIVIFATLAAVITVDAQRQRGIIYRPFDWQVIGDSTYEVYFHRPMEPIARKVSALVPEILNIYSEKLFQTDVPIKLSEDTVRVYKNKSEKSRPLEYKHLPFVSDTSGNVIYKHEFWKPKKKLVILLYPNPQDFNQQMVIHFFLPPGILGFTELFSLRMAFPYRGNESEFKSTLAHEMFHALEKLFIKDHAETAHLLDERSDSRPRMPIWATEGMAEFATSDVYLDSLNERDDYRRARTAMRNVITVTNEEMPSLEDLAIFGDFNVYTLGYELHHFMASRFTRDSLMSIRKRLARHEPYDSVWAKVFGAELLAWEVEWWKSMKVKYEGSTFFGTADNLPQMKFSDKTAPGISQVGIVGSVGFDRSTDRMVFYEQNKKWGLDVMTFGFDTSAAGGLKEKRKIDNIEIDRQFDDKTLWYRADNAPAILGNRVVVTVSKTDQDYVRIYEYDKDGNVELKEEFSIPGLLWVRDISFITRDSLLFIGIDTLGQNDVYGYSIPEKQLIRFTNTSYQKDQPNLWNGKLVYIESGGPRDAHYLVMHDGNKVIRYAFEGGYIDQWVQNDHMLVARVLRQNGVPELVLWPYGNTKAYIYRYGDAVYTDKGTIYVRYPIIDQLIGFRQDSTLLVHESKSRGNPYGRFVGITLDTGALEQIPLENVSEPGIALLHKDTANVSKMPDQSSDYHAMVPPDNTFYYSFPEFSKTDATGEHGFAISSWLSTNSAVQHLGVRWFDFSGRLRTQTAAGFTLQPRWYFSTKSNSADVMKEGIARFERKFTWPFNLEDAVSVSLGLGFLVQQPPDLIVSARDTTYGGLDTTDARYDTTKYQGSFSGSDTLRRIPQPAFLQSPFLKLGLEFTSDGTFLDFFRGTRHGHYFNASWEMREAVFGPQSGKILNTIFSTYGIHYWRPWEGRFYVASRLSYGLSTGYAPYAFFLPDLYREPGLYSFNWDKSFGNKYLTYSVEARFPLIRIFLTDYEFWEHRYPFWFFSFSVAPFIYGGDIAKLGQPFRFVHRAGLALKMGIFGWWPLYLRFEEYKYFHEDVWRPAMTFEVEY